MYLQENTILPLDCWVSVRKKNIQSSDTKCCGLTYPDPSYTFYPAKEARQTSDKWDISCILLRTNVPQPTRLVVREVQCQRELFLVTNTPTTPLASYTHTQGNWGRLGSGRCTYRTQTQTYTHRETRYDRTVTQYI